MVSVVGMRGEQSRVPGTGFVCDDDEGKWKRG